MDPSDEAAPSRWLERFVHLLPPRAHVLDVAAGSGRHSRWLTDRQFVVTAVDRDSAALAQCGAAERVCADLEQNDAVLGGRTFDAIVVTNYLHRPLFPAINSWLATEGVLIYETFAVGQEAFGRPRNPDFLLRRGELLEAFASLVVVAFEEGVLDEGEPRVVQRLCATRTSRPRALR